jgi:hypothetical protein
MVHIGYVILTTTVTLGLLFKQGVFTHWWRLFDFITWCLGKLVSRTYLMLVFAYLRYWRKGISSMLYVKSLVQLLTSEISSYRWSKSWWMTLMMLFIASTKPGTGKSLFWLIPHVASTMARVREPRSILVISPYKVLTSAHMAEAD